MSSSWHNPGELRPPEWVTSNTYKIHVNTIKIEFINSTDDIRTAKLWGPLENIIILTAAATRVCLCNPVITHIRRSCNVDLTVEISNPHFLTREIFVSDPLTQRFHVYKRGSTFSLAENAAMAVVNAPNYAFPDAVDELLRYRRDRIFHDESEYEQDGDEIIPCCTCIMPRITL